MELVQYEDGHYCTVRTRGSPIVARGYKITAGLGEDDGEETISLVTVAPIIVALTFLVSLPLLLVLVPSLLYDPVARSSRLSTRKDKSGPISRTSITRLRTPLITILIDAGFVSPLLMFS